MTVLKNVSMEDRLTFSKWAQAFFPSGGIHSNIGLAYGLFKNTDPEIREKISIHVLFLSEIGTANNVLMSILKNIKNYYLPLNSNS